MKISKQIIKFIIILSSISVGMANTLSLEDNGNGTWNVIYFSESTLSGFQFNVDGATVTSATGGVAEEAGFLVSTSTSTVLGFSLSGSTISAGSGILVQITFEGNTDSACIDNLIICDSGGAALDAEIINCNTIKYSE